MCWVANITHSGLLEDDRGVGRGYSLGVLHIPLPAWS